MSELRQGVDRQRFVADYVAALRDHLSGVGEGALTRAYDLGRMASTQGIGLLELAELHHGALAQMGLSVVAPPVAVGQFLSEALSPFEMAMLAFRDNVRLLGLNEMLAQQNMEIDRARTQLRSILDATTAVICLRDAHGRYLFVNRQFKTVFGVDQDDVIGKTADAVIPPGFAQLQRAHDASLMAAGAPQQVEETIALPDGERTYLTLKFPLVDGAGDTYAVCDVATDITERKRADDALRAAKEATERANRELEAFSHAVAHDLRAPLRSIDGFGKLLEEDYGGVLDDEGLDYLRRVRAATQRMAQLVDDLLELSTAGLSELRRTHVDLTSLARAVVTELQQREPQRRVRVHIEPGLQVEADGRLLAIAMENLLGNAWKFTGHTAQARIEFISLKNAAGQRVYEVRDNGVGFDMANAGQLFGAFQRLHHQSEFPGTGIGLSTVQRIVHRHGGRIWAHSEPGVGTSFFFTL